MTTSRTPRSSAGGIGDDVEPGALFNHYHESTSSILNLVLFVNCEVVILPDKVVVLEGVSGFLTCDMLNRDREPRLRFLDSFYLNNLRTHLA